MAKTSAEYIALTLNGKSEAFRTAYANIQDTQEAMREAIELEGKRLLDAAIADGFIVPRGKTARVVVSRFDGKPQIMLTDAVQRRSF